jgi:competence protein ComFB
MSLRERYNFEYLINEAERIVLQELERELDKEWTADVCTCQDCVLDMAAYALNNIEPLYRVSLMGTLYAHSLEEDSEYTARVNAAVVDAIKKIAKNPSHD